MKFFFCSLIMSALAMMMVSCDSGVASSGDGKIQVVTTATMVTDLVKIIGGDRVNVEGLMGEEVDPHSYDPVFQDIQKLRRADVVFYVGLHLEGKMQESLESMAKEGKASIAIAGEIETTDLLAPQEDFPGSYDPHVWGDPLLWAQCANSVANKLAEIDPEHADEYQLRAANYIQELNDLKAWAEKRISEIPEEKRTLITAHDAFFYFGRAYGFKVKGLQGLSTESEVGIGGRRDLVELIKKSGVKAVFGESSINNKGIREVADEAGVKLVDQHLYSDAMGKRGDVVEVNGESYDRGTYIGMQKHNVNVIVEALK